MIIGIVILVIGIITLFGYCIIASAAPSGEEKRKEDEEQLEWLRKQKDGDLNDIQS